MAIGVYSAAAAAGRRIPDDLAVVSCDDIPFAQYMTPALTSVRIPFAETGARAVDVLIRRINGEDLAAEASLLPVELIVRASCGVVGSSDRSPAGTVQVK
jgi:LacI family transcriptional regulator